MKRRLVSTASLRAGKATVNTASPNESNITLENIANITLVSIMIPDILVQMFGYYYDIAPSQRYGDVLVTLYHISILNKTVSQILTCHVLMEIISKFDGIFELWRGSYFNPIKITELTGKTSVESESPQNRLAKVTDYRIHTFEEYRDFMEKTRMFWLADVSMINFVDHGSSVVCGGYVSSIGLSPNPNVEDIKKAIDWLSQCDVLGRCTSHLKYGNFTIKEHVVKFDQLFGTRNCGGEGEVPYWSYIPTACEETKPVSDGVDSYMFALSKRTSIHNPKIEELPFNQVGLDNMNITNVHIFGFWRRSKNGKALRDIDYVRGAFESYDMSASCFALHYFTPTLYSLYSTPYNYYQLFLTKRTDGAKTMELTNRLLKEFVDPNRMARYKARGWINVGCLPECLSENTE